MRKNSRKGFTIVELVIVIAVIAILAAVLIPTFSGIIDKANTSADIQLIREANMLIQAEMIDLDRSLTKDEADKVLTDNGIDISKVTNTNNTFYYDAEACCFVIWNNETNTVVFPEESDFLPSFKLTYEWDLGEDGIDFAQGEYIDSGFVPNWDQDFTIITTGIIESFDGGKLLFGNNVNVVPANRIGIDADSAGYVMVFQAGFISKDQYKKMETGKYELIFDWKGSDHSYTLTITQGGKKTVEYTAKNLTGGISDTTWRFGGTDGRSDKEKYKGIHIDSFKIEVEYEFGADPYDPNPAIEYKNNSSKTGSWDKTLTTMPAKDTTITANWNT